MELRPAYKTCSTFLGAVPHFWDAVPQIVELFHKKVELFHFVSVFLDTADYLALSNSALDLYLSQKDQFTIIMTIDAK